jgi:hypothetical protein
MVGCKSPTTTKGDTMKRYIRIILTLFIMLATASYSFAAGPVKIVDATSTETTGVVSVVNNQIRSSAKEFIISVLEGEITGHAFFGLEGYASNIGVVDQALWDVPTATQTVYVFPAAAATVTVVSSDATDNQAGVGARSVTITGLLAGHIKDTETLLLHATDGTIAVTSVKEWLRINRVEVVTAGTATKNAGNLTIKSGTDIVSYVPIGTNVSNQLVYTVAVDEALYVVNMHGSGAGTKNVEISLFKTEDGGLPVRLKRTTINNNPFSFTMIPFPAKTDLYINVSSGVAGGTCNVTVEGWIKDN